ncbi:hypothetical protein D3C85_1777270 [compost metagenome]
MLILQHLANWLRKDQCPITVLQALVNRTYHAIAADVGIEEVAGDPLFGVIFQQGAEQHSHFSVGQHDSPPPRDGRIDGCRVSQLTERDGLD